LADDGARRVRSDLEPWELSASDDEAEGSGLLGAVFSGKSPKMMVWPVVAWICSATCAEKKTPGLDAIKFAERTLEILLLGTPTVGFVLR
jgi:hypothetical protein